MKKERRKTWAGSAGKRQRRGCGIRGRRAEEDRHRVEIAARQNVWSVPVRYLLQRRTMALNKNIPFLHICTTVKINR